MHAHILSHFIVKKNENKGLPKFPFLCLLVSGGHTQIIIARDYLELEVIGRTLDDAAGVSAAIAAQVTLRAVRPTLWISARTIVRSAGDS